MPFDSENELGSDSRQFMDSDESSQINDCPPITDKIFSLYVEQKNIVSPSD